MATVSRLKQQKREAEEILRQYEKRERQVNSIISSLNKVISEGTSDVNKKLKNADEAFRCGINFKSSKLEEAVEPFQQKNAGADANLGGCNNELKKELRRIEDKQDELRYKIRKLKVQIEEAKEAEGK